MNQELSLWGYFVQAVTQKYCSFSGRARRKEYWGYALFAMLSAIVVSIVAAVLFGAPSAGYYAVVYGFSLALFLPGLGVSVRRLQDIGKSGLWILVGLIPLVGTIVLLVFYCTDSQPGENEYGFNPKEIA